MRITFVRRRVGHAGRACHGTTNWYACHQYSAAPVEALLRVVGGTTSYWNQYAGVAFAPAAPPT